MLGNFNICNLLGINYPIIQGGMARLGTTELVSAVSKAGGLGIIGGGDAPTDWIRDQIRATKQATDKPFGVNILMTSPFTKTNVDMIIEEKVAVVTFGAGNPATLIARLKEAGIKIIPVVSSVALARRLERLGIDAVIAEGMESGGHVGETTTIALVPQVVDAVKVPVIAAGGIADGRGLVAALALGASGVQIGTRFICSTECIAHQNFKEQIVKAQDRATIVTGQSTGHPIRCLENRLTRQYVELEKNGATVAEMEAFATGRLSLGVIQGNIEEGSLMAGQIAGLIRDIKPVKMIIEDIMSEADHMIDEIIKHKQH
ncbi:MAG TPA: enoyl-[acyl-carrier-protein] reductase FabK [Dehalococcoidia bacterium]|nr:enoyl-[acyl-carrier-protein] reductase FabK [Dehalococcoidia bacterium]